MCFYFRFHPLCRSFCRKKMLDFTLIHIKSICHHRWKKTFPYHEKNPSPHLHQAKFQGKPGIRLSEKTSTLNRSIFLEKQAKKKTSANKRQYISCFQYKSLKGFLSTKSVLGDRICCHYYLHYCSFILFLVHVSLRLF